MCDVWGVCVEQNDSLESGRMTRILRGIRQILGIVRKHRSPRHTLSISHSVGCIDCKAITGSRALTDSCVAEPH